jgi:hypothetical protein
VLKLRCQSEDADQGPTHHTLRRADLDVLYYGFVPTTAPFAPGASNQTVRTSW